MEKTGKGYYKNITCKQKRKNTFIPASHQTFVTNYFIKSKHKGLLLYHKLGSGKSCTSIMVADEMLKQQKVSKVYVLTPGSLRSNWISEYCRVCGNIDEKLSKFIFITYNYNIITELTKYDFNDSLVIIDEVHNLLNGYKNKSKNTTSLYEKIMNSDCRVLILSGTPIIQANIALEWENLSTLLDGGRSIGIKNIKDIPDVNLEGIVSYYPGDPTQYPAVIMKPIQKVNMTDEQYKAYKEIYNWEKRIRQMGAPKREVFFKNPILYQEQQQQFIKATKYLLSRMTSNCFYGTDFIKDLKEGEDFEKDKFLKDTLNTKGGWISKESLMNNQLEKMSPKIYKLIMNIIDHIDEKHVVYSFYKSRAGVELIQTLINFCGNKHGIHAEIFSGDVSSKQREKILDKFNSIENRGGKLIKVLLITEAGSEGISVLECNNIHIVESSTRENRTNQAIGRVIRYKSHSLLPKEKQFVNVWRYWSIYKDENLVDEELYLYGLKQQKIVDDFTQKLIDHSIEK